MAKKPTAKQQNAINHFIVNGDKSAAYRHAYNTKKMKVESVHRNAVALFKLPHIAEIVGAARAKASDDAQIDAAWVLKRVAMLADFNINKFLVFKKGIALYDFSKATDDDWYCISEITIDQIGESENGLYLVDKIKLKAVDKLRALDQVGKHVSVQAWKEQLALAGVVTTVSMNADEYKQARKDALAEDDC